jgi:hypothetical protein
MRSDLNKDTICCLICAKQNQDKACFEFNQCKTSDHFTTNLTIQWCDFFHSSWNLQLYFFFFDVEEGVLDPEFHLLFLVSLDFSFRNMKLIVVYVIERITTPIRNVHSW